VYNYNQEKPVIIFDFKVGLKWHTKNKVLMLSQSTLWLRPYIDCFLGKPRNKTMNKHSGFTLIEMMFTIVIMAIMVAFAVPNFNNMIEKNQSLSTANDLLADILLARSEAIKQDALVSICPSSDATTCTGSWTDGWIVTLTAAPNTVFAVREKPASNMTITATGGLGAGLTYNGRGRRIIAANETITIQKGADWQYVLSISLTGRPIVQEIKI